MTSSETRRRKILTPPRFATLQEASLTQTAHRCRIQVNQAWAGHPGTLVESIAVPPVAFNPAGAAVPSKAPDDFSFETFVS